MKRLCLLILALGLATLGFGQNFPAGGGGPAASLNLGGTVQKLTSPGASAAGQCLVSTGTNPFLWVAGSCSGTAATAWSSLTAPIGNLGPLTFGNNTTTFQFGTTTTNPFTLTDTTGNTGTAPLFMVNTTGTSSAKAVGFYIKGTANGVELANTGVFGAVGTGSINANTYLGNALSGTAPVAFTSGTGAISITGAAGQILAGASPAFTATPVLGVNAITTGQLGLANGGVTGNTVTVQNNSATAAYNFNLPAAAGTSGQFLTSGGGGASANTWTTPSGTSPISYAAGAFSCPTCVTTVTGTAPVVSSGGTTPAISINVFGASGASHSIGAVPDPGAVAGSSKFLREDATWVAVSAAAGGSNTQVQYNNSGVLAGAGNVTYNTATGVTTFNQNSNGAETLSGSRATDTTPSGNFLHFQNAAGNADLFKVDVNGNLSVAGSSTWGGNQLTLSQSTTAAFLLGSGASVGTAPFYIGFKEGTTASVNSYLTGSSSVAAVLCVLSSVPGTDCGAGNALMTNPFSAEGDIVYGHLQLGTLGVYTPTRLAVGTNGQCLTSNGTSPVWSTCAAGPGGTTTGAVQYRTAGGVFGGDNSCTTDGAGNLTCVSFTASGATGGYTRWTNTAPPTGVAGTVTAGANATGQLYVEQGTGAAALVPLVGTDLSVPGSDSTAAQVVGLHLANEGQLGNQPVSAIAPNDTTTGTTQYQLAKINASGNAINCGTGDTNDMCYPVISATSAAGNARLVKVGTATVKADASGYTQGNFVGPSGSTAATAHDYGASLSTVPSNTCIVGTALTTAAANSNGTVLLDPFCTSGAQTLDLVGDLAASHVNNFGAAGSNFTFELAGQVTNAATNAVKISNANTTATASTALRVETSGAGGTAQIPFIVNEAVSAGDIAQFQVAGANKVQVSNAGSLTLQGNIVLGGTGGPTVSNNSPTQSLTVRGPDASVAFTGTVTVRGGNITGSTASLSAEPIVVNGGDNASTGNSNSGGNATVRGGNVTGATGTGDVAGNVSIAAGNYTGGVTGAGTGGNATVFAGSSNATAPVYGLVQVGGYFAAGTLALANDIVCAGTDMQVTDCGASALPAFVGVNLGTTAPVQVVMYGAVLINSTAAAAVGNQACVGSTAGKITPSGSACTAGQGIGTVISIASQGASSTKPLVAIHRY